MRKSAYARTNVPFSSSKIGGNDAQSVENDYDKESHQFFNPSNSFRGTHRFCTASETRSGSPRKKKKSDSIETLDELELV